MRYRFILMLFALLAMAPVIGQNSSNAKRVAILEIVDKEDQISYGVKLMIRSNLAEAITATSGYEGYDRVDISSIMSEHEFQRTGMVSDADIKRLGEMTGAQYILATEVVKLDEQNLYIASKILNVESARIDRVMNVQSAMTATDIQKMSKIMAEELFNFNRSVAYSGDYKKVAILKIVDRADEMSYGIKFMIRSNLSQAITATPGYEGYDRVDISSIMQEHEFQRTGLVSNADIKRLGEMTGAQYILIVEVARLTSETLFLTAKILDVETGKIEKTANTQSEISSTELRDASVSLAKDLLGWKGSSGERGFVITDEMSISDITLTAIAKKRASLYSEAAELFELAGKRGTETVDVDEKNSAAFAFVRLAEMYIEGLLDTTEILNDRYESFEKGIMYLDEAIKMSKESDKTINRCIWWRCNYDISFWNWGMKTTPEFINHRGFMLTRINSLKKYFYYSKAKETIGDYYLFYFRNRFDSKDPDKDKVIAVLGWYAEAASQGDAVAQYYLGLFYEYGYGTNKNEKLYKYWMQKAADQGYSKAIESLNKKD